MRKIAVLALALAMLTTLFAGCRAPESETSRTTDGTSKSTVSTAPTTKSTAPSSTATAPSATSSGDSTAPSSSITPKGPRMPRY